MIVGYAGRNALSEVVASRLAGAFEVRQLPVSAATPAQVAGCDVIVVAQELPGGIRAFLAACNALSPRKPQGLVVIDQTVADPDQTRALAKELALSGVALVDAPIQCEKAATFPDAAAILCGGDAAAVARIQPVLDAMCPKVIHFGDSGNGHAARVLVGAVAATIRLATYECAAMATRNGLSIEDMALVLNRSSGVNSASERVLPHLATRERTSDATLAELATQLRLASQLGMRTGAPIMLPNLAAEMVQSLSNELGAGAVVDDMVGAVERSAGIRFA